MQKLVNKHKKAKPVDWAWILRYDDADISMIKYSYRSDMLDKYHMYSMGVSDTGQVEVGIMLSLRTSGVATRIAAGIEELMPYIDKIEGFTWFRISSTEYGGDGWDYYIRKHKRRKTYEFVRCFSHHREDVLTPIFKHKDLCTVLEYARKWKELYAY